MSFSKVVRGESADAYLLGNPATGPTQPLGGGFTTNVAVISSIDSTADFDGLSLGLIVDYAQDQIAVDDGVDAVVASTGVWTFTNFTFTGLVGAKLVVSGAANAGNNGTFAITAVSTDTATTATTGLVNETFGPNVVVYVIHSETASHPAGAWKIFGSNDFAPGTSVAPGVNNQASVTQYGQPPQSGHWTDVTAQFTVPTTIAAVTDQNAQLVSPAGHFSHRHYYAQFTPTGGKGTCRVPAFRKSWGH